jgi:uncharacterized membrane protein
MKGYFTTGLAILLPIVLTIMIMDYLINILTTPFLEPMKAMLLHLKIFHWPVLQAPLVTAISKLLIIASLVVFTLLIGFLGELYFLKAVFRITDRLLHNVPIFNRIYKLSQDLIHSLFSSQGQSFTHAVAIHFPTESTFAVGLVSEKSLFLHHLNATQEELAAVFVPGAVNPTFGFVILYKKEELLQFGLDVGDTMKMLISCGAAKEKM